MTPSKKPGDMDLRTAGAERVIAAAEAKAEAAAAKAAKDAALVDASNVQWSLVDDADFDDFGEDDGMDAGDGTEAPAEDTEEAQKRRKARKERNKRRKLVIYDDRVYMTKKSQKGEMADTGDVVTRKRGPPIELSERLPDDAAA